jgi:pSer/pThr/pTyr-binding forkhead associated (FHA) protein
MVNGGVLYLLDISTCYGLPVAGDAAVSSIHCKVHRPSSANSTVSGAMIEDVSANGTYVNGTKVTVACII